MITFVVVGIVFLSSLTMVNNLFLIFLRYILLLLGIKNKIILA